MKINIILACTQDQGIGFQGKIPWKCKEDLQLFQRFTSNHSIIMGRKTFESIGKSLPNRINIVVTSEDIEKDGVHFVKSVQEGVNLARNMGTEILWVCGGAQIYDHFMKNYFISEFFITKCPQYDCDTFIKNNIDDFITRLGFKEKFKPRLMEGGFELRVYGINDEGYRTIDDDYLDLMERILKNGERRETRNGVTISIFSEKISVDLSKGFPLLTTKKVFFNGVVRELLWFIKGKTDSKILEADGVNIWKGNTSKDFLEKNGLPYEEGIGGPIYGFQWRKFGEKYIYEKNGKIEKTEGLEKGFDQLQFIIDEIKTNPNSRRLFMSGWNPNQLEQMCLPPCHVSYQFYVNNGVLSCQMYQRSADVFLGLPFNIASTALLVHLVAKISGLRVGKVHICIGDSHLYEEHMDAVKMQLGRRSERRILPFLELDGDLKKIDDYEYDNIRLRGYESGSIIKAKMFA